MDIQPKDFFSALAHESRLRCLILLLHSEELCVCELTHAIGASQPHISRHLGQLRELGLIIDRREGLWIHYRINPAIPDWAARVLQETAQGLRERSPFADDECSLSDMPGRPGARRCA